MDNDRSTIATMRRIPMVQKIQGAFLVAILFLNLSLGKVLII